MGRLAIEARWPLELSRLTVISSRLEWEVLEEKMDSIADSKTEGN